MSRKSAIVAILAIIPCAAMGWAATINIPADQPTIQAGIDAAGNGDTVLVAPGTFAENIHFRGKGIVVASRFILAGERAYIASTVITGGSPSHPDSASCVRITSSSAATTADSTAALVGFTVTGGTGTLWNDEHGAGVYREGGGILVQYLSPRILDNVIEGNSAADGGAGIRVGDGYPRIMNNVIRHNSSGSYGGGIVLNYTGAVVANNLIEGNSSGANFGGGGGFWIYSNGTYPKLILNNTIANNTTSGGGTNLGGGIRAWSAGATVKNNIVWGNTNRQILRTSGTGFGVSYCDVQDSVWPGAGNIRQDPNFLDTIRFYLSPSSPGIDAGDSSAVYNDPDNPGNPGSALYPALGGLRNDMGAYGGPGSAILLSPAGVANGPDEIKTQTGIMLSRAWPNPSRQNVSISYLIEKPGPVSLRVYNAAGQLVRTLDEGRRPAGRRSVRWDGADVFGNKAGSGVYFCRLQTDRGSTVVKLAIVR